MARKMTAAQRKAVGLRMKRYWARRRKETPEGPVQRSVETITEADVAAWRKVNAMITVIDNLRG